MYSQQSPLGWVSLAKCFFFFSFSIWRITFNILWPTNIPCPNDVMILIAFLMHIFFVLVVFSTFARCRVDIIHLYTNESYDGIIRHSLRRPTRMRINTKRTDTITMFVYQQHRCVRAQHSKHCDGKWERRARENEIDGEAVSYTTDYTLLLVVHTTTDFFSLRFVFSLLCILVFLFCCPNRFLECVSARLYINNRATEWTKLRNEMRKYE